MKRFPFALGLCVAASVIPAAAFAQEACAPREEIVQKLSGDFREQQQAVGIVNDKAVLEVFVSRQGSWTIIATGTDGNSCVLSAGEEWDESRFGDGLDTSFRDPADRDLPKLARH